jgi:hypothetical protein
MNLTGQRSAFSPTHSFDEAKNRRDFIGEVSYLVILSLAIGATIFLERKTQTALWVQEPTNTAKPQCQAADSNVRHWTIEESLGWKRIYGK